MELCEYKYELLREVTNLVDEFQLDVTEIKFINTNLENKLFKFSMIFNARGKIHSLESEFTKDNYRKEIRDFSHMAFNLCLEIIGI